VSLWVESHQTLRDHPKKDHLAELLFAGRVPDDVADFAAIGLLHELWWWALDYAQAGDLSQFTDRQVAKGCRWAGDPAALMDGLVSAGFVTSDRRIHDWYDYAGKLVERRERNRERMRETRSATTPDTCDARATHSTRTCSATVPNHTVPNHTNQEHTCDAPVDNSGLFDSDFWPRWPHHKGAKQLAGKRFAALSAPQQQRCLTAEGYIIEALDAGLLDPQFLPRAENFVGGTKSYYREWADGIPGHLSAQGNGRRSTRAVDSAFGALREVARQLDSEVTT
jgi:hypothetical protein